MGQSDSKNTNIESYIHEVLLLITIQSLNFCPNDMRFVSKKIRQA